MKKIVLFAAVICGLCGCVKSETVIDESEQHREIAFKPFNTKDAMRAPINSTKLPDDARLGVFAFYHGAKPQKYFEDAIFGKKAGTDNTWAGIDATGASRPYYWPTAGSLDFFAYYPKQDNVVIPDYSYSNGTPTQLIGFYSGNVDNSVNQYDLMYSDLMKNTTSKDAGDTGLAMTLHHALTQVVVNVKKTSTTPKLVIKRITLNDVFLKADMCYFAFNTDEDDNATIAKASGYWVINYPERKVPANDACKMDFDMDIDGGLMEVDEQSRQIGNGALIIPFHYISGTHYNWQTSITIEYTFDNGGVESEVTHTIDLNAGVADADKAVWEMGKKYTYNITIGLNQILFEPTVDDWDEVAGKDIAIE